MTAPSQKQDGAGCKKRKICQNRNALGPAADKKKKEKEKHGKSEKSEEPEKTKNICTFSADLYSDAAGSHLSVYQQLHASAGSCDCIQTVQCRKRHLRKSMGRTEKL